MRHLWISTPVDLIVVNKKGQILLVRRSEEECGCKGKWSIPGGGPDGKEDFESALKREIKEELGCRIKWYKYFKSYYMMLPDVHHVRSVYFYGEIEGRLRLSDEHSEHCWMDLSDPKLLKLDFAFNQRQVVKDFVKFWRKR
jgi:8-oxo-dGTP diphosphatase